MNRTNRILHCLDSLAIIGIIAMLCAAFGYQFLTFELPCALCAMQRMGLYAIAAGLVMNIYFQRTRLHYLMTILSATINGIISLLQVILHIVPGSGSFGASIFGLHMYTWNFIVCLAFIIYASVAGMLTVENQHHKASKLTKFIIALLLLTLIANIVSAFFECGPYLCPSDPQSYWLLDILTGKPWI